MPVEETADALLMLTALAMTQDGQVEYLVPYQALLETWAQWLAASLPDPPFQFCTDDFEGPSAHNVNLALKGILALAAYAQLLLLLNEPARAAFYSAMVPALVEDWQRMAGESGAGELPHFRLQYDLNHTWSLKYNLLWQWALNLTAFPDSVRQTELAYYASQMRPYGLPLDCRSDFAKLDWEAFVAALAFDSPQQRSRLIHRAVPVRGRDAAAPPSAGLAQHLTQHRTPIGLLGQAGSGSAQAPACTHTASSSAAPRPGSRAAPLSPAASGALYSVLLVDQQRRDGKAARDSGASTAHS